MEREDFIIEVYCLACELYHEFQSRFCKRGSLRRGGFAPALTDPEVITIELCGEYFKQSTDSDIFAYFMAHFRPLFPQLKERTAFVRRAANLWQVKAFIHQRLVHKAGADRDPFQVIDTLPIPVCTYTRGGVRGSARPLLWRRSRLWLLRRQKDALLRLQTGSARGPV